MITSLPERVVEAAQRRPAAQGSSAMSPKRSIDDLDTEIRQVMRGINAESYRLLVLVREFDDRLGWAKWSFPNCSEWLAWRCGLSASAAREKLRTAQLARLPAISKAFDAGRLSYTKVRALTRVADAANEDLPLAYALDATASQIEERCRQLRNAAPASSEVARRAWERRGLTVLRNDAQGTMTFSLELPIVDGELLAKVLDRAVESRKTRALSAALRRAVEARDRHCTFPGCRRTEGTVPHHIKPWGEGGEHAAR